MGTKTIWDGKDLPPIGSWVLIKLASIKDKMLPYKVEGYEVRPIENAPKYHFYVAINLRSRDGVVNQRSMDEVYPVDNAVDYGGKV